jgi:hypothetical protein
MEIGQQNVSGISVAAVAASSKGSSAVMTIASPFV